MASGHSANGGEPDLEAGQPGPTVGPPTNASALRPPSDPVALSSSRGGGKPPDEPSASNSGPSCVQPPTDASRSSSVNVMSQSEIEAVEASISNQTGLTSDQKRWRIKLFRAALDGNWNAAKAIYERFPKEINAIITPQHGSALHIAVLARKTEFVKQLVNYQKIVVGNSETTRTTMSYEIDLTIQNQEKKTAFHLANESGQKNLTEILWDKLVVSSRRHEFIDESIIKAFEDKRTRHLACYHSALNGDWEAAKAIYDEYPQEINDNITRRNDTVLHIAVAANKSEFVKQLINYSKTIEVGETGNQVTYRVNLNIKNESGNTAFSVAAASGAKHIVKIMLQEKRDLAMKRGSGNMLPLFVAALLGHREIVSLLYNVIKRELEVAERRKLFIALIESDVYDVALEMLNDESSLSTIRVPPEANAIGVGDTALHAFARKSCMPSNALHPTPVGLWNRFVSRVPGSSVVKKRKVLNKQALELIEKIWRKVILMTDSQISKHIGAPTRLIFTAAKQGNHEFLKVLIRWYPDIVFKVDIVNQYTIFHYAILYRHKEIFKLIHEIGSIKNVINTFKDKKKQNMLHLAAIMPSESRLNVVPGAALQLQREWLWFEEVKKVTEPRHFKEANEDGKTPETLFVESHEELRKSGEKWMINTANSCVIVAILIVTVAFTAAFTIPGGYKGQAGEEQPTGPVGMPIFLHRIAFKIFAIADAVSLIFSTTSVLIFLSILTSRYAIGDFLSSLPNKLLIGFLMLFMSIASMMVSFMAAFFITFDKKLVVIAIVVAALAVVPVICFMWQEGGLFIDVFTSTYRAASLFKPNKDPLFSKKLKKKTQ